MELSLAEIRNFMLNNGCKVTNHALVKHFKEILTNPETQSEARKQFKTYVNILATIRTEDKRDGSNEKEKYLILKSKYLHECPSEDNLSLASGMTPLSPARSISSDCDSPGARQPPPYRPPPIVSPGPSSAGPPAKIPVLEPQTRVQYKDCINEYRTAIMALQRPPSHEPAPEMRRGSQEEPPQVPPRKRSSAERSFSVEKSSSDDSVEDANKENVAIMEEMLEIAKTASENQISVKEATKKFNRIASEEEKIISPSAKKKPEKTPDADINDQDTLVSDPKAKEWLVSAARCNYQELSKLASDRPWLVKLQDPTTGYTALHWAAKHGNENVVKLIAGTYKANANAQTNGGYTPLHIAMQFGRDNIFELLQNVYKADRDILDWSGKKALDYRRQKTAVSASTYSKIKAKKKQTERESGFLRIGSLRNFLGVGSSSSNNHHHGTQNRNLIRSSVPSGKYSATSSDRFDKLHKSWGSADNLPHNPSSMPPPKNGSKKRRTRRHADYGAVLPSGAAVVGSHSVPTTPNQPRAPMHSFGDNQQGPPSMGDSDSDSACGFDSNWHGNGPPRSGSSGSYGVRPTYI